MGCGTSVDGSIFFSGRGIKSCTYCMVVADYLCDFPLGDGATCDARLCRRHAIDQAHARIRLDYCPPHDGVEKAELRPTWAQRRDAALHACLAERLRGRPYAPFLVADKDDRMDPGAFMPNGFTECSGFCLTEYGDAYSFWFGWDGEKPALTEWDVVSPKDQPWSKTLAYQKARERLGIGMAVVRERPRRRARRFIKVRR